MILSVIFVFSDMLLDGKLPQKLPIAVVLCGLVFILFGIIFMVLGV